jgi:hypothetical protein
MTSMTKVAQIRPDNARKIAMKNGKATFYLYTNKSGQPCVREYIGRRRARNYYFRSDKGRCAHIAQMIESVLANEKAKKERQEARKAPHNLQPGQIMVSSWGYEQTNVDFYQVVSAPSSCFVELQKIGSSISSDDACSMSGKATPESSTKIGETFRKKVTMESGSPSVKIDSHAFASVWNGTPKYVSWYA